MQLTRERRPAPRHRRARGADRPRARARAVARDSVGADAGAASADAHRQPVRHAARLTYAIRIGAICRVAKPREQAKYNERHPPSTDHVVPPWKLTTIIGSLSSAIAVQPAQPTPQKVPTPHDVEMGFGNVPVYVIGTRYALEKVSRL